MYGKLGYIYKIKIFVKFNFLTNEITLYLYRSLDRDCKLHVKLNIPIYCVLNQCLKISGVIYQRSQVLDELHPVWIILLVCLGSQL
jgi:hypothetical protein